MAYSTRPYAQGYSSSGSFPAGVKWLLVANLAVFVLYFFSTLSGLSGLFSWLQLVPAQVLGSLAVWQPVTYLFLHSPFQLSHILFNMLALWMFGADLERTWGTRRFLQYYFLCGVGAGLCVILAALLFGGMGNSTIGASGAIYGLLLAYGVLYPDRTVLFSFLFPMKAKYFVMIIGAITFFSSLGASGGGVSHIAHLGGMLFGLAFLKRPRRVGGRQADPLALLVERYRTWKLQRAKRKFQVYMQKRERDRDRFVH